MSFLVFCSFEVGGIPFRMAEILNRYKVETYYIYSGKKTAGSQFNPIPLWKFIMELGSVKSLSR